MPDGGFLKWVLEASCQKKAGLERWLVSSAKCQGCLWLLMEAAAGTSAEGACCRAHDPAIRMLEDCRAKPCHADPNVQSKPESFASLLHSVCMADGAGTADAARGLFRRIT